MPVLQEINKKIYNQYLESFKKGVYNYIKEDYDPATKQILPRKYFSGGSFVGRIKDIRDDTLSITEQQQRGLTEGKEGKKIEFKVSLLEETSEGKNGEVVKKAEEDLRASEPKDEAMLTTEEKSILLKEKRNRFNLREGVEIIPLFEDDLKLKPGKKIKIEFKTAGWRGKTDEEGDFSTGNVGRVADSMAEELLERINTGKYTPLSTDGVAKVLVAYDSREGSEEVFAQEVLDVFSAYGDIDLTIAADILHTPGATA